MNNLFVHLDHLINKDDIYYTAPELRTTAQKATKTDEVIRYIDIKEERGLYANLRKPDFQRQTNAWTPEKCVGFLDSVLKGLLIPYIILWRKPSSKVRYVLDGAHRISVIRAWMENDWGDSPKARQHYARHDWEKIQETAQITRELVANQIGEFKIFAKRVEDELGSLNELERLKLSSREQCLLEFFDSLEDNTGLLIHWAENNSYEEVAESFVRINQGGQALDEFEVDLIKYRKSSIVRAIMAIAGEGKGNYWPSPESLSQKLRDDLGQFSIIAANIHKRLFEPTYEIPPTDVNQPFMPAPPYFRKHLYLREILPILVNNEIIKGRIGFRNLVTRGEYNATPDVVIRSGQKILVTAENKLKHLTALTNTEPLSLDIVPLFYWYNLRGQFIRALCYGFFYWLLSGSDEDIKNRKLIFSGNRDRFEYILHTLKPEIASIHFSGGAALYTTAKAAEFFQRLLELLHEQKPGISPQDLHEDVIGILEEITNRDSSDVSVPISKRRSARNTSIDTHGKINRLFKANHRCPICNGHIDWKRKHQLDHNPIPYKEKQITTPDGVIEAHQFCNNDQNKAKIEAYRSGTLKLSLPKEPDVLKIVQMEMGLEIQEWDDEREFTFVENELEDKGFQES